MSVVASNTAWEDIYAQILDGPGEFDDEGDFFPDLDHSSPLDSRTPSPTLLSPPSSDGAEYYALDGALLDADFDFPAIYFPPEPNASSQKRKHPFSTRKDEQELEPPSKRQKTLALPLSTAPSTKSNTKAPSLPKRRGRPPSKSHQRTEGAGNRGGKEEEDEDIIDIEAKIEEIEERKKTISSLLNTTPSSSPSKHQSAPFSFPFPYSNHGAADSLDLCSSLFADTDNSNNSSSTSGKGINHSFSFPSPTLLGSTAKNISLPNIPLLLPESLFFDASSNSLPPSPDSRVPKPIAKTEEEEDDDDDETEEEDDDDDTEGDNDDNDDEGETMRDLNEDALLSFILDDNATAIGAFSFGEMPFRSSNRLQTRFDVHYAISKLLHGQHLEGAIEILAKSFDSQNGNDPSLIMSSNPNNFEFDIFELDETLYIELKEYVEDCLRDQIIPLSPSSSSSSSSSPLTISPPYPVVLGLDDDGNESESEDLDIDEDSVSIVMVADEVDSNPIISHSSRRYRSRQSQHQQQHRSHHHHSHHHRHSPFQSASKTTPRSSASYVPSKSPSPTSNNGPKAKSRRRNTQSTVVSSPSSNGTTNQRQKRQTHRSSPPLSPPSSSSSSSSLGPSPKRKGSSPKSKNTSSNSHTFSNTTSSSSLSSFNTSSACSDSSSSASAGHQTTTATATSSVAVSGRHIPDQSVLSHVFQREEVLKIVSNEDEEDEFVDVL